MANISPFGSAPELAKLGYESIKLGNGEQSMLVYGTKQDVLNMFRGQSDIVLCCGASLANQPDDYEFLVMRKVYAPLESIDDIAEDDIRLAAEELCEAITNVVSSYDLTEEMLLAALDKSLAATNRSSRH